MQRVVGRAVTPFVMAAIVMLALCSTNVAFAGGSGHAGRARHNTPQSCFFTTKASQSQNFYSGSQLVGTVSAYIEQSSCQASDFRIEGVFDGTHATISGCASASINVSGSASAPAQNFSNSPGTSTSSFGISSCATNYLDWTSSVFAVYHGALIQAQNTADWGSPLSNKQASTSYTYP